MPPATLGPALRPGRPPRSVVDSTETVRRLPRAAATTLLLVVAAGLAYSQNQNPQLATQSAYLRRSITTLDSVWFQPGSLDRRVPFEVDTLDRLITFYVHIPRFDYTALDPNLTDEFRRQANRLPEITAEALAEVIDRTLTAGLLSVLNDPEVQQVRRDALLTEADLQRFAESKARSTALTAEQLTLLFNSSYFYLPYLSSVALVRDRDENVFRASVSGGILWYRLRVDPHTGATTVDLVAAGSTGGLATGDPELDLHRIFVFGGEVRSVSPAQFALLNASQAFARNLGTLTKDLDDFQLTAQVVEAAGGSYRFPLGTREGVKLDDGFHLIELVETDAGAEQRRVGYVRVRVVGDNHSDPAALSEAVQMLGGRRPVGTTVLENPVSGVDLRLRPQYRTGISIPAAFTSLNLPELTGSVLADDVTSAMGIGAVFSYNLAPLVGVSQLFLNADASASFLIGDTTADASVTPYLLESYLSATKKFWLGPVNLQLTAGAGVDWLELHGRLLGTQIGFSRRKLGVKAELDAELMVTPNLHVNVGAGYRFDLLSISSRLEVDGEGATFADPSGQLMSLGGLSLRAGVNLQLRELPFNVFGFLYAIPSLVAG